MREYVFVLNGQTKVVCPFCGEIIDLNGEPVVGCVHLDIEDYITPEEGGGNVWFHDEEVVTE